MKVESPFYGSGTNPLPGHGELHDLLASADDTTRAIVEAGFSCLRTEGMEPAARFLSFNLTKLRDASRARLQPCHDVHEHRLLAPVD